MAVVVPGKLLFLAHPRTGSNALRNALHKRGGEDIGGHHAKIVPLDGELVFSVIRDPMEVLQGWYANKVAAYKIAQRSFPQFIHDFYDMNFDHHTGRLFYHAQSSNRILLYPNLQQEFDDLLRSVSLEPVKIDRINVTESPKPPVTSEAIRAMKDRFGRDVDLYTRELDKRCLS